MRGLLFHRPGRNLGCVLALVLLAAGCGQSDGGPSEVAADPEPTVAAPDPEPTETAEAPDEVAFTETDITISGDTGVLVVPGETVEVDHLVRNTAANARSTGYRVDTEDEDLVIELSTDAKRLKADEIGSLVSTVTVPADAEVGQVFEYSVIALNVADVTERSVTTVQLLVTDAVGERPTAGPDAGFTTTNERVLIYVIGDDVDPDGDLDMSSLRVIDGGFAAAEIVGDGNGTITYVPFANVTGSDIVMYEICDAEDRCDTALVDIDVTP